MLGHWLMYGKQMNDDEVVVMLQWSHDLGLSFDFLYLRGIVSEE